jgi:hypothetical protein
MRATKRVAAWVRPEVKARFRALATARGLTESKCLGTLVEMMTQLPLAAPLQSTEALPVSERLTVRLRPSDGVGIAARAAARGCKPSTYVAALVRAHLRESPVIPAEELRQLLRALEAVSAVGRLLSQIARVLHLTGQLDAPIEPLLDETGRAVQLVRIELKHYIHRAAASWAAPNV